MTFPVAAGLIVFLVSQLGIAIVLIMDLAHKLRGEETFSYQCWEDPTKAIPLLLWVFAGFVGLAVHLLGQRKKSPPSKRSD